MNCVKCKAELPEGAKYCHMCGKKQEAEKRKTAKRANGTGTVYKLQGRRRMPWVAAKDKVVIGYYETKADATKALNRLEDKTVSDRFNMTFEEVYQEWKKEHFKSLGESGKEQYERAFKLFEPLHKRKFRDLRKTDYQPIIDNRSDRKRSTVEKDKQLITQMSEWAISEDIMTTNFASYVKINAESAEDERTIFSDGDIKKLKSDNSETAKIILMLIYTGMRIGELFSMPVSKYHETYCIGGEKTKAGKDRIIPIMPEGREYFSYFVERADGKLVLSGYSGSHDIHNFRSRDYYPLLERLGIERKVPHCTRHTFISNAVKSKMQPEILQKIVGHADYSTTVDSYTHIDKETLIKAAEKI